MTRAKFEPRRILLRKQEQLDRALAVLANAPLDEHRPLEFLVREEVKVRKPDQNSLMWAGPLRDIAEQCWANNRQYSAAVWHEYFKAEYLPEAFNPELCKEGYEKWGFKPDRERILVGSSTDLTVKGFSQYLTQIHVFGTENGVEFHEHQQHN